MSYAECHYVECHYAECRSAIGYGRQTLLKLTAAAADGKNRFMTSPPVQPARRRLSRQRRRMRRFAAAKVTLQKTFTIVIYGRLET